DGKFKRRGETFNIKIGFKGVKITDLEGVEETKAKAKIFNFKEQPIRDRIAHMQEVQSHFIRMLFK
ncbi:unnamed protein product, partial [Dovyalis caffra]